MTLVSRGRQVMSSLDPEMAAPVLRVLADAGVDVRLGATIVGAEPGSVRLADGSTIGAVLVVEASGVRPDRGLAALAGIEVGPSHDRSLHDPQAVKKVANRLRRAQGQLTGCACSRCCSQRRSTRP
ncbi:FAD-dependent oxidoreductase [Microbacterium sp. NPDC090007]|uniref:FAD-dependent oxidoreductase n=1 Tax=Microbacterium sp. NPDC090007 TaxID=3364204 RepID=UPI00381CA2C0